MVEHALGNNRENCMSTPSTPTGASGYLRSGQAWYLVIVLMIIYIVSFVDRQIMSLLVKPIRAAMEISDFQVGLLMGLAFAVFYTFFGIPLGWLVDRYNRLVIIGVGLVMWSFMTMGCGLSNTFYTLLLFRFGVGIGEAALSPAAYSIIADAFPPKKLATAISIYSMGIYLGSGLAVLFGASIVGYATAGEVPALPLVGEVAPWQFVFLAVGLPGIPIALLLFTVKEPARHKSSSGVSFGDTMAYIKEHIGAFLAQSIGFGLLAMVGYATMGWVPTFFARTFGWAIPDIAMYYGIAILTLGSAGILLGGRLGDLLRSKGHKDGAMITCILSALLTLPFMVIFPLVGNSMLSMAFVAVVTFASSIASGVAPTVIQQMMPPAMRGQASAIYLFIVNLIAMGLGPTSVGFLNSKVFGDENMKYSLVTVGAIGCVGAALLIASGRTPFRRAAAQVEAITAHPSGM